ncbi:unnamed protein product [Ambrosiozyma monospora]|uniref:Unnamed protein product n=1 Tax=Ambrosiozyma monospora TaxID=43982 RepID=A0ACB5UAT4_AMBMO|nr:unnamed protein product [Ambrosiozyma monospora]
MPQMQMQMPMQQIQLMTPQAQGQVNQGGPGQGQGQPHVQSQGQGSGQLQYFMMSIPIPPPPRPPNINKSKLLQKCTCKQDNGNRIPRPRNAFILYRQKHHQALLEEDETIIRTNSEVSKELGRRWKNLPPEEKNYWNQQAQEEKKRHAENYQEP